MKTNNSNKLQVKDYINIGIFSAILMVLYLIAAMTNITPITYLIYSPATITLAVTLRYFPAIVEEWSHIREAMRLRPIASAQKKTIKKKNCGKRRVLSCSIVYCCV